MCPRNPSLWESGSQHSILRLGDAGWSPALVPSLPIPSLSWPLAFSYRPGGRRGLGTVRSQDLHRCISMMLISIFLQFLPHYFSFPFYCHAHSCPWLCHPCSHPGHSICCAWGTRCGTVPHCPRSCQPHSGRLQADSFPPYHGVLSPSSTGSGAVEQTPLPLSSCKNSINTFLLIRNAGTDVVDCSDRSNLAFITKAACCLPAFCSG